MRVVTDAPPNVSLEAVLVREMAQNVLRVRDRALFFMDNGSVIRVIDAEVEPGISVGALPLWPVASLTSMRENAVRLFEDQRRPYSIGPWPGPDLAGPRMRGARLRLIDARRDDFPIASHSGLCDVTCAVCLEDATEGALLKTLPCSHAFHPPCIDFWMRRADTCPVCRLVLR